MNPYELKQVYARGEINKHEYMRRMYEDFHQMLFSYTSLLRDSNISNISIDDDRVIMTTRDHGVRIICNEGDQRTSPIEILNLGDYESEELAFLRQAISPNAVIFDIGANIGWYSLNLAVSVPNSQILAFEPIPRTYDFLRRNVELNQFSNIEMFNFGFSDQDQELLFYYYPEGAVNASLRNLSDRQEIEQIPCQVKVLDDFMRGRDLSVDLIKCDVEGAELLVIQGAWQTIKRDTPLLFLELLRKWSSHFGYHPQEVVQRLADIGYECFVLDRNRLRQIEVITEETVETNFFFLHPDKHVSLKNQFRSTP